MLTLRVPFKKITEHKKHKFMTLFSYIYYYYFTILSNALSSESLRL